MRTFCSLLLLLSLSACTQVDSLISEASRQMPSAVPAGSPTGIWNTTYGDMTFDGLQNGRVTATYKGQNGQLDGTLAGRIYTGIWTEPAAARRCSTTRNGTPYWGRFEYVFNATMTEFTGGWDYCDERPDRTDGSWTGVKR